MYQLTQRVLPALGKEAEVRALLIEWAQHQQATKGRNIAVSVQLFSSDGPAFTTVTRADDLTTFERYRHENLEDADWQRRAAELLQRLRAPVASIVAERLIPASGSGPVGIVTRAAGFPALGKEREFRSMTEDFVKASQAAGVRIGMSQRIFSPIGVVFGVQAAYTDMAAFDKSRQERASATREVVQAAHQISREPIIQRVFEVLVPLRS
jgi:hypothetical protein